MAISEKTIRNEEVMYIDRKFNEWVKEVRLNGREKDEIEAIIEDLKALIDY